MLDFINMKVVVSVHHVEKDLDGCGECLERMAKGEASKDEVEMLGDVTNQIAGHTICAFGEGSSWPVQGLLRHFKKEIEEKK